MLFEMEPGGFEDLLGPFLSKKNQPHPIILTLSSKAHKFSQSIRMGSAVDPIILFIRMGANPVTIEYRMGGGWSTWMGQ